MCSLQSRVKQKVGCQSQVFKLRSSPSLLSNNHSATQSCFTHVGPYICSVEIHILPEPLDEGRYGWQGQDMDFDFGALLCPINDIQYFQMHTIKHRSH